MGIQSRRSQVWKLKSLVVAAIGLAVFLCTGLAVSAEKPAKLVIHTIYPGDMAGNEVFPSLQYFKTLLEERTAGAYEVEIFPGGQLGTEVEGLRECQAGVTVHMALASSGAFSSFYKKYQAIVAPYLFPNRLTAWAFFDSPFFADFMGDLTSIGLRYLGTMDDGGGFVVLTNNLRPVHSPSDLKGMRIRTEENPAHMAIMDAMGASTVPMAWGQLATALATKTAHGQFNAPSIVAWAKFWETQSYVTFLNHIYNTNTWVVNDKWFKQQSQGHQEVIVQCAREVIIYSRGLATHLSALAVGQIKERGMKPNHITPKNMAEFSNLAQTGYRRWAVDKFGLSAELLESVQKEVGRIQKDIRNNMVNLYAK